MAGCKICRGIGKLKCMFCGYRPQKLTDMPMIDQIRQKTLEEEVEWLQRTHDKLKNLGMAGTGSFSTDEKIRERIGDWGELSRGEVITREGDKYGVRLDSGLDLTIEANYRDVEVGQRVTVRFLNGEAKL